MQNGPARGAGPFGAEQKLFGGPFSVSGSVNETASGELSKSIKAGFKHAW